MTPAAKWKALTARQRARAILLIQNERRIWRSYGDWPPDRLREMKRKVRETRRVLNIAIAVLKAAGARKGKR